MQRRPSVAAWEVVFVAKKKDDEEKTYEVKDKRRVNPDGTMKAPEEPAQEAQPEQAAGEQPPAEAPEQAAAEEPQREEPDEEAPAGPGAELPVPRIHDLLQLMIGMLAEQAWVRMGIRLAPGHKESDKDLDQAKIAIDTIVVMVDKIHPYVSEDDRRALRGLVSDLQINFVRQS